MDFGEGGEIVRLDDEVNRRARFVTVIKKDGRIVIGPKRTGSQNGDQSAYRPKEQADFAACFDALVRMGRHNELEHLPPHSGASEFADALDVDLSVVKKAISDDALPGGYTRPYGQRLDDVYRIEKAVFLKAIEATLGAENRERVREFRQRLEEFRQLISQPEPVDSEKADPQIQRALWIVKTASVFVRWQRRLEQRDMDALALMVWLQTLPPFFQIPALAEVPGFPSKYTWYRRFRKGQLPGAIRLNSSLDNSEILIHRDTFILGASLGLIDEKLEKHLSHALQEREQATLKKVLETYWFWESWTEPTVEDFQDENRRRRRVFRLREEEEELTLRVESTHEHVAFCCEGPNLDHEVTVMRTVPGLPLSGAAAELRFGVESAVRELAENDPISVPADVAVRRLAKTSSSVEEFRVEVREWREFHTIRKGRKKVRKLGSSAHAPEWESKMQYSLKLLWDGGLDEITFADCTLDVDEGPDGSWLVRLVFENYQKDGRKTTKTRSFLASR